MTPRLSWKAAGATLLLHGCVTLTWAVPTPCALFGPNAVLQRDEPVIVWGEASPDEIVTVKFQETTGQAKADASGHWEVTLPTLKTGQGGDLIFESTSGRAVSSNVVVGDVWFCSGQSNMELPVSRAANAAAEIAEARYPEIRQFKVPIPQPGTPAGKLAGQWEVCTPETVGKFTAAGYFFARDLHQVNHQPQGLINCSWGGTPIEAWLNPELIATPSFQFIAKRWEALQATYPERKKLHDQKLALWTQRQQEAKNLSQPFNEAKPIVPLGAPGDREAPSQAYEWMTRPVIPYTVRAVLWYQGEANAARVTEYRDLLHAVIADWRQAWKKPTLPVIVVQLPNFKGGGSDLGTVWAQLREAQASVLSLPATGLVVTVDIGNPVDIHPLNKQDVGKRLALVARRLIFAEEVVDTGPQFLSATREGNRMTLQFETCGRTMHIKPAATDGRRSFELAGADHQFYAATASVSGNRIIVSCAEVPEPQSIRYCWRGNAAAVLFNDLGLPAAPFRTDHWTDGK